MTLLLLLNVGNTTMSMPDSARWTGLEFDGAGGLAFTADQSAGGKDATNANYFKFEFLVKFDTTGTPNTHQAIYESGGNRGIAVGFDYTNGKIAAGYRSASGGDDYVWGTDFTPVADVWYHFVFEWTSGSPGTILKNNVSQAIADSGTNSSVYTVAAASGGGVGTAQGNSCLNNTPFTTLYPTFSGFVDTSGDYLMGTLAYFAMYNSNAGIIADPTFELTFDDRNDTLDIHDETVQASAVEPVDTGTGALPATEISLAGAWVTWPYIVAQAYTEVSGSAILDNQNGWLTPSDVIEEDKTTTTGFEWLHRTISGDEARWAKDAGGGLPGALCHAFGNDPNPGDANGHSEIKIDWNPSGAAPSIEPPVFYMAADVYMDANEDVGSLAIGDKFQFYRFGFGPTDGDPHMHLSNKWDGTQWEIEAQMVAAADSNLNLTETSGRVLNFDTWTRIMIGWRNATDATRDNGQVTFYMDDGAGGWVLEGTISTINADMNQIKWRGRPRINGDLEVYQGFRNGVVGSDIDAVWGFEGVSVSDTGTRRLASAVPDFPYIRSWKINDNGTDFLLMINHHQHIGKYSSREQCLGVLEGMYIRLDARERVESLDYLDDELT